MCSFLFVSLLKWRPLHFYFQISSSVNFRICILTLRPLYPLRGSRPSNFDGGRKDAATNEKQSFQSHACEVFQSRPFSCLFYLMSLASLTLNSGFFISKQISNCKFWVCCAKCFLMPFKAQGHSNFDGKNKETTTNKETAELLRP